MPITINYCADLSAFDCELCADRSVDIRATASIERVGTVGRETFVCDACALDAMDHYEIVGTFYNYALRLGHGLVIDLLTDTTICDRRGYHESEAVQNFWFTCEACGRSPRSALTATAHRGTP